MPGLLARNPEALKYLYDQYSPLLFSVLIRITRNAATAEDLLQETFLRIWNHAGDFEVKRGSLSGWMVAIARNIGIDFIRSCRSEYSSLSELPIKPNDFERVYTIQKIFLGLTPLHRKLLQMAYFDGYSQTEIAQRLHQPLGTVKSRTRAALKQAVSLASDRSGDRLCHR